MKLNCKPGDMAVVVRGMNRDSIVEVVKSIAPIEEGNPCWHARSARKLVAIKRKTGDAVESNEFRVRDSWLRPISGVPVDEETRDEVAA